MVQCHVVHQWFLGLVADVAQEEVEVALQLLLSGVSAVGLAVAQVEVEAECILRCEQ